MKRALAVVILILILFPACSLFSAGPGISPEEIRLTNDSGETVYYGAWELENSHLVDPLPHFDPESSVVFPALAPGDTAPVRDIVGYEPDDDVRFFLYAVRQHEGEKVAALVSLLTVTAEELRRNGGRVVVSEL